MLHSSQTAIRQTYFFDNAISETLKVKDPHDLTAELQVNPIIEPLIDTAPEDSLETPEHSNFVLAKNIAIHRSNLIRALASVPISALWLITKLEQNCNIDKDDPLASVSDTSEFIVQLHALYESNLKSLRSNAHSFEAQQAKADLLEQINSFSFSAEQLKDLSTFVFFAYYSKLQQKHNYIFQPAVHEAVVKKLQSVSNAKANLHLQDLKNLQLLWQQENGLEAFLVPQDDDQHAFLISLLQTELHWLNARQSLAVANSRLVSYLANQYKGGFLDFNDLVQEGQSGLLKAVDRFDYQKGFQFSTYAAYWIRQAISRSLIRNERVVRLPFGQMANISKVYRIKETLYLKHGFEPSIKELAEQTQLSEDEINNILLISQSATSLDTPVGEEDQATTKADFIEQQVYEPAVDTIFRKELHAAINQAISTLSSKEAQVINCRFGINYCQEMTLEEIGHELNLTRERVRQIQVTAISKLKKYFGEELNSFL